MHSKRIKKISLLFLIIIFSLMAENLYGAPLSSKEVFKSAQEAYKSDKYKKALQLFIEFRKEFPKDKRADDALLYIGRIYKRMGKIDMAMESFSMILALPEESNRVQDASFDLARIYYQKKSYEQTVLLLKPFQKAKDFDKHDFRLFRLLAKTRYQLGKENNKQNKKEYARRNFLESVDIYALLADNDITDKERINDLIGMAESLFSLERLEKEGNNDIYAKIYKESAQEAIKHALALNKDEKRERYLAKQLRQLRKISAGNETSSIKESFSKITLELLGKTNSKVGGLGSEISLKGSFKSPVNNGKQYRLSGNFKHDDFTFKTSNFMEDEIDEKTRLIQKTDRFSIKFEKLNGLRSPLNSRLTLKAKSLLADDEGEDYRCIEITEKIGFKVNDKWKLGFSGFASRKSYPDDNDSDREKDYVSLELSPDITRYINKSFNINFSYSFNLKQYLNSKYYLELLDENGKLILDPNTNKPIRSNEDKRYLTHSIALLLEGNKKKTFYPSLEYIFSINEAVHYDNKIRDDEYRIIKDYGDFMKHKIIAGIVFTGFRDFEIDTEVSAFIKDFGHYPARIPDPSKPSRPKFIDEMRKDKSFQFDTSIQYLISSHKENRLGNIFLKIQLFYEYQTSNMRYEVSSKTNYDFFTFSAGLKLDLP